MNKRILIGKNDLGEISQAAMRSYKDDSFLFKDEPNLNICAAYLQAVISKLNQEGISIEVEISPLYSKSKK